MTSDFGKESGKHPHTAMSAAAASTLMRLRASRGRRPIDALAERLEKADGALWLSRALEGGALRDSGITIEQFLDGELSLDALESIRKRSKALLGSSESDARLAGLAGYFLSIAIGLVKFDKLLTTSGGDEVADHLIEFAAVAPVALGEVLCTAAGHKLAR